MHTLFKPIGFLSFWASLTFITCNTYFETCLPQHNEQLTKCHSCQSNHHFHLNQAPSRFWNKFLTILQFQTWNNFVILHSHDRNAEIFFKRIIQLLIILLFWAVHRKLTWTICILCALMKAKNAFSSRGLWLPSLWREAMPLNPAEVTDPRHRVSLHAQYEHPTMTTKFTAICKFDGKWHFICAVDGCLEREFSKIHYYLSSGTIQYPVLTNQNIYRNFCNLS